MSLLGPCLAGDRALCLATDPAAAEATVRAHEEQPAS